jgi:hypothetical protein
VMRCDMPMLSHSVTSLNQRKPVVDVSRVLQATGQQRDTREHVRRAEAGRTRAGTGLVRACQAVAALALAARLASTPSSQSLRMTGTAVTSCSV